MRPPRSSKLSLLIQAIELCPGLIKSVTMKCVAVFALLLVNLHLSQACLMDGQVLFCPIIPSAFPPGYTSLLMNLRDVGEISSTLLRSDNLTSVTRLRIESSGVTAIAEGAFSSFQNLTSLSLNQNFIAVMNSDCFGRPDILIELSLTENRIEVLNQSFFNGLIGLKRLSLNKNRIRTIDPNTFSSQTLLEQLDLSENRMTRVSPQVFRALTSARIKLHRNPWDCSCGAEDFGDFLKDLQSNSLIDKPEEVTCETPSSLRGRPVWNVSMSCVTSPSQRPPSAAATVRPKPTDVLTIVPPSTAKRPARPTSDTRTSILPEPSDKLPTTATPKSETCMTSPPSPQSVTEISVHPKPTDLPTYTLSSPSEITETCASSRPSSNTNNVCTLAVVIVVLCVLLFGLCFLGGLHWRKRNNKTVTPGCPKENGNESKEGGTRSSPAQALGCNEKRENKQRDSETGWTRSFTGVRSVKSANAILFTDAFCASVKDVLSLQTETEAPSRVTGNQSEGQQDAEVDGAFEILTNTPDVCARSASAVKNLDKDPHCVLAKTDALPYLTIDINQSSKESTGGTGRRSQIGKVMGRISTWPPTAIQWKRMREEEGSDIFTVWTPKFPDDMTKVLHPSGSRHVKPDHEIEKNQIEDLLKINDALMKVGHCQTPKLNATTVSVSETHAREQEEKDTVQDPATVRETKNLKTREVGRTQELNPAEENAETSRKKSEQRKEAKRAEMNRERAENRCTTGSKTPSGGGSPDDETLLSGNEYAFMDLLHEVVQNNGRWTRERWKQAHANKRGRDSLRV